MGPLWASDISEQQPTLVDNADDTAASSSNIAVTPCIAEATAANSSNNVATVSLPTAPGRQLERMDSEQALCYFMLDSLPGTAQNDNSM